MSKVTTVLCDSCNREISSRREPHIMWGQNRLKVLVAPLPGYNTGPDVCISCLIDSLTIWRVKVTDLEASS